MMLRRFYELNLAWPLFTFVLVFATGLYILYSGHIYEDAYILFAYVENFANGHGISYNAGGERAEGATDFLWFLALTVLTVLGLDVAVAAILLNALAAAFLCWLILSVALKVGDRKFSAAIGFATSVLIAASPAAAASYGGFSTLVYSAMIAWLFVAIWTWRDEHLALTPLIGLLIGLIRPDGVLIGLVGALAAALLIWRSEHRARFLTACGLALVIGGGYFLWRYSYFGLLFPLPIYVKSYSESLLPGFRDNVIWLSRILWFAPFILIAALHAGNWRRLTLAILPFAALIVAMFFMNPTQNIAFRFQNSGIGIVLLVYAYAVALIVSSMEFLGKNRVAGSVAIMAFGLCAATDLAYRYAKVEMPQLLDNDYSNYFPFILDQEMTGDETFVVTEAGKTGYWMSASVVDIIGLNSPEIAVNGLQEGFLASLDADAIFIHTGESLKNKALCRSEYKEVSASDLEEQRNERFADWTGLVDPPARAEGAVLAHLIGNGDRYRIFLVCFLKFMDHLHAVRIDGKIDPNRYEDGLRRSHAPANRLSYMEMKRALREERASD